MPAHTPRLEFTSNKPRAIVVGVQLPDIGDQAFETSLRELERLASTLGLEVVGRVVQKRQALAGATLVGEGKLRELAELTGGQGFVPGYVAPGSSREAEDAAESAAGAHAAFEADGDGLAREQDAIATVLVDHDLTPTQMRNLEKACGVEVLDRSMVILSIFKRHAHTREAKLQVEIAHLAYMAPRLREASAGADRQRGGIGGKGAGETALELNRRAVRDRIAQLKQALVVVQREADTRRSRRLDATTNTVALIGYTNAGKSSLMRALTGDDSYVADQLFATLDTSVRLLLPETRPRVLVSDTVGFIKKLPHDLVASFRSTLAEAKDAALALHVVDASDPAFRDQAAVTEQVLVEIGATDNERLLLLNKCDRLSQEQRQALAEEFPDAMLMSAKSDADVKALHARIVACFEDHMEERHLVIPYSDQKQVALLHEHCRVLSTTYEADGAHLHVRAPAKVFGSLGGQ